MAFTSSPLLCLALASLPFALSACGEKAPPGAPPPPIPYAEAILYDTGGKVNGKVVLRPEGGALAGKIDISWGLAPGPHGMHIHTVGKCAIPDFASAGSHLNPDGKQHGAQNPMGPHQGDLPVLVANERGSASMTFTANTTLDMLFDADGAAFVVHEKADDMQTDPTGNSGNRVMCGVLYRKMP